MQTAAQTATQPNTASRPRHIALIMDGNGRWAHARGKRRTAGHHAGYRALRHAIEAARKREIEIFTIFAFSSENWGRPQTEINRLRALFFRALRRELDELTDNDIRIRFIGETDAFGPELQRLMQHAETVTGNNASMCLNVAVSYGGRWDICRAMQRLLAEHPTLTEHPERITSELLSPYMCLAGETPPDLLIRTGGERRISNFMLWQLSYTELYFTDTLWPDFREDDLDTALQDYARRERRFGCIDSNSGAAGA